MEYTASLRHHDVSLFHYA